MTDIGALTVNVEVKRRSLFSRLLYLPKAFSQHYRTARRSSGIIVSAYAAWLMASLIVTFRPGSKS